MAVQITVIFQGAVRGAGAGQARPACGRAGNGAQAPGIHAEPEVREFQSSLPAVGWDGRRGSRCSERVVHRATPAS